MKTVLFYFILLVFLSQNFTNVLELLHGKQPTISSLWTTPFVQGPLVFDHAWYFDDSHIDFIFPEKDEPITLSNLTKQLNNKFEELLLTHLSVVFNRFGHEVFTSTVQILLCGPLRIEKKMFPQQQGPPTEVAWSVLHLDGTKKLLKIQCPH